MSGLKRKATVSESLAVPKKIRLPTKSSGGAHVKAPPAIRRLVEDAEPESDSSVTRNAVEFESFSAESDEGDDEEELAAPAKNQVNESAAGGITRTTRPPAKANENKPVLNGMVLSSCKCGVCEKKIKYNADRISLQVRRLAKHTPSKKPSPSSEKP